jgi:hypothetical protein
MKTNKNKTENIGFVGYSDATEDIDKAIDAARRVKDILPSPEKLQLKNVPEKERKLTLKAWKRYRIKNSERGHKASLSKTLNEPTKRLDTSIILPRRVFEWIGTKRNKAAFIREIMIKNYEKSTRR